MRTSLRRVEDAAREDWAVDSHGLEFMEQEYFCDAIFELVDVWMPAWCDEPHEMVDFLDTLLGRCTHGDPLVWMSDDEIEYGGYEGNDISEAPPPPPKKKSPKTKPPTPSSSEDDEPTRPPSRTLPPPVSTGSGLFDKPEFDFDWSLEDEAAAAEKILADRANGETEAEAKAKAARQRASMERALHAKRAAMKARKRFQKENEDGPGLTLYVEDDDDGIRSGSPTRIDPETAIHSMRLKLNYAEMAGEAARRAEEEAAEAGRPWLFTPNARGTNYTGKHGSPTSGRSRDTNFSALFVSSEDEFGFGCAVELPRNERVGPIPSDPPPLILLL